jgi:hypothetical protein
MFKVQTVILKGKRGGGFRKVPKKCHLLFEWPLYTTHLAAIKLLQNYMLDGES